MRASPWQFKGDAFLVEGLQVGADPGVSAVHPRANEGAISQYSVLSSHQEAS